MFSLFCWDRPTKSLTIPEIVYRLNVSNFRNNPTQSQCGSDPPDFSSAGYRSNVNEQAWIAYLQVQSQMHGKLLGLSGGFAYFCSMHAQTAIRWTLLVSLLLSFGDPVSVGAVPTDSVNAVIDRLALEYIRKPNTHALAIGVLDDRNSAQYFYGHVTTDDRKLPDESTVFEIGALTETFTAAIFASMILSGQVDPDAPITVYLPDSVANNAALRGITLKNLANYTSGLPHTDSLRDGDYSKEGLLSFLKNYNPISGAAEAPETHAPGEIYRYSDLGYGVIGTILEEITHKTYQTLIDEYINSPLDLSLTTLPTQKDQDLISEHNPDGEPVIVQIPEALIGSKGLKSSLSDLLVYIQTHFKTPDTPIEQALAFTREFTFFDPPETDLALAWHLRLEGDNLVYFHRGQTSRSSCYIAFAPDRKRAVVLLSNAPENVESLGKNILNVLLNNP